MMLQSLLPDVFYWLVGFILLVLISASITGVLRLSPRFMEEGSTGLLADWWRWINKSRGKQSIHAPKRIVDRHIETWSCPICGSNLDAQGVKQLEMGYKVECKYCGATLGHSF